MNDYELNNAIANALGYITEGGYNDGVGGVSAGVTGDGDMFRFDFDNWNTLMPLVVEHEISMYRTKISELQPSVPRTWIAGCGRSHLGASKNPQRALALCLLKVLESKNGY